jgi:hypothetical protein
MINLQQRCHIYFQMKCSFYLKLNLYFIVPNIFNKYQKQNF